MENQQSLLDYIRQARAAGQSDEQIKIALSAAGWQEANIQAVLETANIVSVSPQNTPNEANREQTSQIAESTKYSRKTILYSVIFLVLIILIALFVKKQIDERKSIEFMAEATCASFQMMKDPNFLGNPNIKSKEDIYKMSLGDAAAMQQYALEKMAEPLQEKYNLSLEQFQEKVKIGRDRIANDKAYSQKVMNLAKEKNCF